MSNNLVGQQIPLASQIAHSFAEQYYTVLQTDPSQLACFYQNDSMCSRGGITQTDTASSIGLKSIKAALESHPSASCKVELSVVDCQETINSGVVITAIGILKTPNEQLESTKGRGFVQTFFLALQSTNRYYVRNDIFRFLSSELHEQPQPSNSALQEQIEPQQQHVSEDQKHLEQQQQQQQSRGAPPKTESPLEPSKIAEQKQQQQPPPRDTFESSLPPPGVSKPAHNVPPSHNLGVSPQQKSTQKVNGNNDQVPLNQQQKPSGNKQQQQQQQQQNPAQNRRVVKEQQPHHQQPKQIQKQQMQQQQQQQQHNTSDRKSAGSTKGNSKPVWSQVAAGVSAGKGSSGVLQPVGPSQSSNKKPSQPSGQSTNPQHHHRGRDNYHNKGPSPYNHRRFDSNCSVYVSGVPSDCNASKIKTLFSELGNVVNVTFPGKGNDYYCFVDFDQSVDIKSVIASAERNPIKVGNNVLIVQEKRKRDNRNKPGRGRGRMGGSRPNIRKHIPSNH